MLSLQANDLVQFFRDKIDTVKFLVGKKKQECGEILNPKGFNPKNPWSPGLLRSIELAELEDFKASYKSISKRLDAVQSQIHTIRSNFEALLASHNSRTQAKLTTQFNWISRFSISFLPMNLVAALFGMNVTVPMQGTLSSARARLQSLLICFQIGSPVCLFGVCLWVLLSFSVSFCSCLWVQTRVGTSGAFLFSFHGAFPNGFQRRSAS
jgi:Mg2+ and Co2+ transporter CorA